MITAGNATAERLEFDADFVLANERLEAMGWTDGLPVIPPTEHLVQAMLARCRHAPGDVLGRMQPIDGVVNVVNAMQAPWFTQGHYRSDSNQHWRSGCPHEELARGEPAWLQLLTHPEIWVYPGDSMRETMLSMLDAEREKRLEQLAADRIDLS